jgi:hypothetical protein
MKAFVKMIKFPFVLLFNIAALLAIITCYTCFVPFFMLVAFVFDQFGMWFGFLTLVGLPIFYLGLFKAANILGLDDCWGY